MKKVDAKELLKAAGDAAHNAYAPYSNEPKGAALLCSDGSVYACCNVEFATFGGSVCAELGALVRAINDGKQSFSALALTPYRFPCGACRQFFNEFGLQLDVFTARQDGTIEQKSLGELLPNSFGKSNL
jgi:cytidine deaminase